MRIAVWRTGHEIADTVAYAIAEGACIHTDKLNDDFIKQFDVHIGYGILRGMDKVFRACGKADKPWFNIDRGYWKPGHFDGYYRVSLCGTQQTSDWPDPDWGRWKSLGLEIEPMAVRDGYTLVCPPTDAVETFFGFPKNMNVPYGTLKPDHKYMLRPKGTKDPIDWDSVGKVITFNSSVGWEALRRGIPVVSDPTHSIVGAWQVRHGTDKREELFATMAALQLTIDEMRQGKLLPLLKKLLPI